MWTLPPGGVAWEWRFQAPLGLLGVPTLDGWLLAPLRPAQARQWVTELPLPVLGYPHVSRAGDGQGGQLEDSMPVAAIDRVELCPRQGGTAELVAHGRFGPDLAGDHYRGALAVDAVAISMDLGGKAVPGYRATSFEGWQIRGGFIVAEHQWDRSLLSRPRVWRSPVGAP